jgi:MtN3 and saliva related transmembrane protein
LTAVDILGFVAATLTTGATFPQVYRTWKTRSVKDISFWMFFLTDVGIVCWLLYGLLIVSWPVILANIVATLSVSAILYFKVRYGMAGASAAGDVPTVPPRPTGRDAA